MATVRRVRAKSSSRSGETGRRAMRLIVHGTVRFDGLFRELNRVGVLRRSDGLVKEGWARVEEIRITGPRSLQQSWWRETQRMRLMMLPSSQLDSSWRVCWSTSAVVVELLPLPKAALPNPSLDEFRYRSSGRPHPASASAISHIKLKRSLIARSTSKRWSRLPPIGLHRPPVLGGGC